MRNQAAKLYKMLELKGFLLIKVPWTYSISINIHSKRLFSRLVTDSILKFVSKIYKTKYS